MLLAGCRNNTVVIIMPTQNIELTKLKLYNNILQCYHLVTTSNNYTVTLHAMLPNLLISVEL